jgi:putative membrane protein
MSISKEERDRIANAIRSAEARTSGEIVCVLARTSTPTTALPVILAAAAALATPWILMALTAMTVQQMLSIQVVIFLVLLMLLCLPSIRVALMPRKMRRAVAHRMAMEQFISRGIVGNKDGAGILVFVSLAERYARIIAGDEIAARVPQSAWQGAVDALISHMRDGRIADGFIAAIDACGDELARHFPQADGSHNKLPDRIYMI